MKTLSDKEITSGGSPAYNAEDVKEFIKKLKEEIVNQTAHLPLGIKEDEIFEILQTINKLAGDKLI